MVRNEPDPAYLRQRSAPDASGSAPAQRLLRQRLRSLRQRFLRRRAAVLPRAAGEVAGAPPEVLSLTGLGPFPIHAVIAALATLSGWLVVRAWARRLPEAPDPADVPHAAAADPAGPPAAPDARPQRIAAALRRRSAHRPAGRTPGLRAAVVARVHGRAEVDH